MSAPIIPFDENRVEQIAREYCRLLGLDPDESVGDEMANARGGAYFLCKRWQNVAVRVRDEMTMEAARYAPNTNHK